jgi:branched-chain amino acid transport system substrate-binding protein
MKVNRILAIMVGAIMATACGGGSSSPSGTKGTVSFYSINALTGQSAPFGKRTTDAVKLLAQQVNAAGGLKDNCGNTYNVNINAQDMANDPAQAVTLARSAASDSSVLGIIGPTASVGYVPIVPVAGQLKIPVIGTGTGALIAAWNPYAYRVNVVSSVATPLMLKYLEDTFHFKRLAIIYDIMNDSYKDEATQTQSLGSKLGYQVVSFQSFRTGDTSLQAQLTAIKAANPDWIAYEEPGDDLSRALNQSADLGLGNLPKSTGYDGFDNPSVWDVTKGKAVNGYSWTAATSVNSTDPAIVKYVADYKTALSDDATIYSLYGHDGLALALDAVKRACTSTDRNKFNNALRSTTNFKGLATTISFSKANGENQSAKISVIQTTARATSKVVS